MKLIVKNTFRDKTDHVTEYAPGTVLEVHDEGRSQDLVERGLCAVYDGKKKASVVLASVPEASEKSEDSEKSE